MSQGAGDCSPHLGRRSSFHSSSLFIKNNSFLGKGSFKKYVTEKIAILTPTSPPHVTACHVPVDTPSSLHNILARHPSTT